MIARPPRSELLGTLALVALGAIAYLLVLWIYTPVPQIVAAAAH